MAQKITETDKRNLQRLFDYLKQPNIAYRGESEGYNGWDWDILSPSELDKQKAGHCVDKANYCYLMAEKFGLPKPKVYYALNVFDQNNWDNHAFAVFFGRVLMETSDFNSMGVYFCRDLDECFSRETMSDADRPGHQWQEAVFIEYTPENKHYDSTVDFFNSLLKDKRSDLILPKPAS